MRKGDRVEFRSTIYNFFYRLSELSFISYPIDYPTDVFWAMMEPYLDDDDKELWETLMEESKGKYEAALNKVKVLTILLYKQNVIRQIGEIEHKQYQRWLKHQDSGRYIATDIKYEDILIRHLILLEMLAKKYLPASEHVDLLWAYLTPYVTEEDYKAMEDVVQSSPSPTNYITIMNKIRIASIVADRAGFQMYHGIVDERVDEEMQQW